MPPKIISARRQTVSANPRRRGPPAVRAVRPKPQRRPVRRPTCSPSHRAHEPAHRLPAALRRTVRFAPSHAGLALVLPHEQTIESQPPAPCPVRGIAAPRRSYAFSAVARQGERRVPRPMPQVRPCAGHSSAGSAHQPARDVRGAPRHAPPPQPWLQAPAQRPGSVQ